MHLVCYLLLLVPTWIQKCTLHILFHKAKQAIPVMFVWSRVHNLIGVALAMEIYLPRYLAWKLLLHMTRMFQYFVRTVFSMHSWTLLMSGAQWADQRESTESCTDRVWFICIWTVPHAQFPWSRSRIVERFHRKPSPWSGGGAAAGCQPFGGRSVASARLFGGWRELKTFSLGAAAVCDGSQSGSWSGLAWERCGLGELRANMDACLAG